MKRECGLIAWVFLLGCSGNALLDDAGAGSPPEGGGSQMPSGNWSLVVDLSSDTRLNKMWGSAADDIWLVGGGGFWAPGGTPEQPNVRGNPAPQRIVHFDGTRAEEVAAPGDDPLSTIWGRAKDDVWAAGGSTLIHFDGERWSRVTTPFTPAISAIWGASASDVWFAGGRTIRHWVAGVWSEFNDLPGGREIDLPGAPTGTRGLIEADILLSLWGFSASDVWAGGGSGTLLHWDGLRWRSVPTGSTLYIYGLWGASPDDIWGVGNGGYRVRWNGAGLEQAREDWTGFNAVRGRARDDVWGVGSCCWKDGPMKGWAAHYDGAKWSAAESAQWEELQDVWTGSDGTVLALTGYRQLIRLR